MKLKEYFKKIKKCRYCSYKVDSSIPSVVQKQIIIHVKEKHPDKRPYVL